MVTLNETRKIKEYRMIWIDIAKGIAIIFVIMSHLSIFNDVIRDYWSSFYMSMFFVCSGITFKSSSRKNTKEYIITKIRSLLTPYFAFNCLALAIYFMGFYIIRRNIDLNLLKNQIISIFLTMKILPDLSDPTWFLMCLFWVSIIYYIVSKMHRKNQWHMVWSILLLSAIGYFLVYKDVWLPYKLQTVLMMLLLYYFGDIIGGDSNIIKIFKEKSKIIIAILLPIQLVGEYFQKMGGYKCCSR